MAACIIRNHSTNRWVLKTGVSKPQRLALRPIRDNEHDGPIPDDVLDLARKTGFYGDTPEKPEQSGFGLPKASFVPPDNDDLKPFVSYYLLNYGINHPPTSLSRIKGIFRWFLRYIDEYNAESKTPITKLSQVNRAILNGYYLWRLQQKDKRIGKGIQKHVCVAEMTQMSGLFSFAQEHFDDDSIVNPFKRLLKRLRKENPQPKETKYIEPKPLKQLFDAIAEEEKTGKLGHDFADCIRIMLYTGMRRTACVEMRFEWIDEQYVIHVPKSSENIATKSKGYLCVIPPEGRGIIDERRKTLGSSGRVFPGVNNGNGLYFRLRRIGNYSANLHVFPHRLRHTMGTTAVDKGLSLQVIQHQMGHGNITVTQRYANMRIETQIEKVNGLTFDN